MKSIYYKVLLSILTLTLSVLLIVTGVLYVQTAQTVETNYLENLSKRSEQMMTTLGETLKQIHLLHLQVSCDPAIKARIASPDTVDATAEIANILHTYENRNPALTSIYVYLPAQNLLITSDDYPITMAYDGTLPQTIAQNPLSSPVLVPDIAHSNHHTLTFATDILDEDGGVLGYVLSNLSQVDLYYDYIIPMSHENLLKVVLTDANGAVIASLDENAVGADFTPTLQDCQRAETNSTVQVLQYDLFSQCGLYLQADRSEVLQELSQTRSYFLSVCGIFILCSCLVALYFTRVIVQPIRVLSASVARVADGHLEEQVEIISDDEIGQLGTQFNIMLENIQHLIQQLIAEEQHKKDAEFQALQYQITPHFMYNTLNSIKFAAHMKGEKQLANLIGDFVSLLQMTIGKSGSFITIAEEMQILQKYIRLQEFRSGEQFSVAYEVDDSIADCMIPRLLLQPLVENSILHGIDLKEKAGMLRISATRQGNRILLSIQDNGRGMTAAQIEQLLSDTRIKKHGFSSIGVCNIRERLHLHYGTDSTLHYTSSSHGTTATISIPFESEGGQL